MYLPIKKLFFYGFVVFLISYQAVANAAFDPMALRLWRVLDCDDGCLHNGLTHIDTQLADFNRRLSILEGIPAQLQDAQSNINGLKNTNEQYRVETDKIKQETIATTTRLNESVAAASEDLKQQKLELQQQKKEFEDYKIKYKEQVEAEKLHKLRQERLYDAFNDIFEQGNIQDPVVIELFAKACEISSEFKTLFEDLKTVPTVRRLFKQKAYRLEVLFWTIFKEHKDMEALIDQPTQPAIGDSSGDSLTLGNNLHKEL